MGKDRKLENPLLKRDVGLSNQTSADHSSSFVKPMLSFHSSLLSKTAPSSTSKHSMVSSLSKSRESHQQSSLKTSLASGKVSSPSLFNKNLGSGDGLQKKSVLLGKTTSSLKKDTKKDKLLLKPALQNVNLSQSTTLTTGLHQLGKLTSSIPAVSSGNEKLAKPSRGPGHAKIKKSKTKGKKVTYERTDTVESSQGPTYDISLADTLQKEKCMDPGRQQIERYVDPEDFLKVDEDHFVEKVDDSIVMKKEKERVDSKKLELINLVSIALLRSPNLEDVNDETRKQLMDLMKEMASIDPEFILKLALYTRTRLNIRIVTNFMLSYSAYLRETRPFLKKYFGKSIILPTDWVKVSEIYQTFFDKSINVGSLPAALRNVMVVKFAEFNEYQLGKHNKDKKSAGKDILYAPPTADGYIESRKVEIYTLKRLVRKLHISEPVYHVMSILGKKYPDDSQAFYQSRLPGMFDETKAGQRMRLAIPETWETQVSLKKNIASTWEELLDHRKLPFMAMLRNLRNMLLAGISQKHHRDVLKRLTDEKQVINSKQFPFRFLSAYEVLDELEELLSASKYSSGMSIPSKKRSGKPIVVASNAFNAALLKRYKNALDTALKISTIHNISPISGTTVILIHWDRHSDNMPPASAKSVSSKRTVFEMCLLLGLMCKFHCEDGILLILDKQTDCYIEIENLKTDKILENISMVQEKMESINSDGERYIMTYLNAFLTERKMINNFVMLGGQVGPVFTNKFMDAYRKDVNPTCLRVSVLLTATGKSSLSGKYDVNVNGFSDQVLQYVAERGNGKQLTTIEKIDIACGLEEIVVGSKTRVPFVPSSERIERPVMPWKTVRVFISSTFKDMHGERDLLTRYVFPELRCWCYNYCLNVYEVDLRWGITEKQSQSSQQIEVCLREVTKADLFIGILGERYGWVPDNYDVSDPNELEWLKTVKPGYSITELEMRGFKHKEGADFKSKALFYFRDKSFVHGVPKDYANDFISESKENEVKMQNFKEWVRSNNAEIYNYSGRWGGVIGNKPIVSGLEEFGQRVLNNLWNTIKVNYLSGKAIKPVSEVGVSIDKHYEFATEMSKSFVGRKKLVDQVLAQLEDVKNKHGKNLLLITGRSGSGKTAFMSKVVAMYSEHCVMYNETTNNNSCCYFVDAVDGKKNLLGLVKHILETVNSKCHGGHTIPETYSELKLKVEELFKSISKQLHGEQCIIFVDSLDKVDVGTQSSLTDWIPEMLPKGIYLVIGCTENTACQKILSSHKQLIDVIKVGAMELADRADFVRQILANYGKALDESAFNNQMKLLLSKKDSSSPLYLKLACDELRMFGVYEKFYNHIKNLAQTVPQLIEFCMQRMEMENGEHLMRDALSLLYFSRQGLTKEDLFDTLNMLQNFSKVTMETITTIGFNCFHDSNLIQQEIPLAYFMKMCQAIKIFLNEETGSGVMKLVYSEIIKIVQKRYINGAGLHYMSKVHIVLAGFYKKQADPGNNLKWSGSDKKALIELPYHLTASAIAWKDLQNLLTDINFIKAKVEGNMCGHLLEDFQADIFTHSKQIQLERNKVLNHHDVMKTKEFISENIHILTKYPMLLKQQALNSPDDSYIYKCVESFHWKELKHVIIWLNKSTSMLSKCSLTITQQQPLLSVCLSQDETMIACGMEDGQLILYDKNTTKELKTFVGHSSSITSCSFIGLGKICSASEDGLISIWDVQGGHRLHLLNKHKRQVSCCKCTDDGKLLVSSSWDNTAKLWNVGDGSVAGELSGFIHPFNCLALDIHQKHAALGGWNRNIVIWNILENVKTDVYKGHSSSVRALAYAPSGLHLASASLAGEILLWSTENGAMMGQLSNRSCPMTSLSYTPSGQHLVAASTNASIKIWHGNLGAAGSIYKPEDLLKDSPDYALAVAVRKEFIAVGYNSGKVALYSHKKNVPVEKWTAHASSIRSLSFISQDQHKGSAPHLITASDDGSLKRWSTKKIKCLYTMKGHSSAIRCVRSKEAFVISGSEDCTLHVWPGLIFEKNSEDIVKPSAVLRGHTGTVTCCDISSCETMALSGSSDKSFVLWNLNKKISLLTVTLAHADGLTACSWSDVGNYIVTGSNDFTLKLWDTKFLIANKQDSEKLKEKVKFVGHTGTINDVKYKYGCVISASTNGCVKVWTHKGIEITTFNPHAKRINSCDAWTASLEEQLLGSSWSDVVMEKSIQQKVKMSKRASMNDVLVYAASDDGTVSSYRPFKPCLMDELYGHTAAVTDVLVSTKKPEVISCSFDKTIKIWERKVDSEVNNATAAHTGEVSCLATKCDINIIVSGGYDGYICIHSIDTKPYSFLCSPDAVKGIGILSDQCIVTGDNLGNVSIWNIEEQKVIETLLMDSPVQCIEVGGKDGNYIVVSCYTQFQLFKWAGSLVLIAESLKPSPEEFGGIHDVTGKAAYVLEYPMPLMAFLIDSDMLVSAENYSYFRFNDVSGFAKHAARKGVKTIPKKEFERGLKAKRSEEDSAASCVAWGGEMKVFIGNMNGTISFNEVDIYSDELEKGYSSIKIHDDYVTGILINTEKDRMVTASKDCTVKVWKNINNVDPLEIMQQVGLYHCRAPVTKLKELTSTHLSSSTLTVVLGDANGNVEFLEIYP